MSDVETSEATAPAPPQFVDAERRVKTIPLSWPVTYDGKVYGHIGLKRMTQAEVSAFITKISAERRTNPDSELRFPIFVDDAGALIPDALMDALDADDADALNEAALDFLPRRFRSTSVPEPETQPNTPPSPGATTEPS